MDGQALAQLREQGQEFFLPLYKAIVARHPLGIEATRVKQIVRDETIERCGFDPFEGSLAGTNPSTGESRASQWANNLVSNRVLDRHMIVARGRRTVLYPLTDHSDPVLPGRPTADRDLGEALSAAADQRSPLVADVPTTRYLRSPALAQWVRELAGHRCIVGSSQCVVFTGRDGRPYVEVHHIIPMVEQRHKPHRPRSSASPTRPRLRGRRPRAVRAADDRPPPPGAPPCLIRPSRSAWTRPSTPSTPTTRRSSWLPPASPTARRTRAATRSSPRPRRTCANRGWRRRPTTRTSPPGGPRSAPSASTCSSTSTTPSASGTSCRLDRIERRA